LNGSYCTHTEDVTLDTHTFRGEAATFASCCFLRLGRCSGRGFSLVLHTRGFLWWAEAPPSSSPPASSGSSKSEEAGQQWHGEGTHHRVTRGAHGCKLRLGWKEGTVP
jgi:hypothetical protein